MTGRRIVVVLPDPPLPLGIAAARWFYVLVRGLQKRGHRVTTFASCGSPEESSAAIEVFPPSSYDLRLFPRPRRSPWRQKWQTLRRPHSYVFTQELRQALADELEAGFDVLHLEDLWTGWLGRCHRDKALLNVHYSFDIDLASVSPGGPKEWLLRQWQARAARRLLRSYAHVSTLTPRLSAWASGIVPDATVDTIPLGLDLSQYPFARRVLNQSAPIVSLIGSFTWYPTIVAARRLLTRLWPALRQRVPQVSLEIVGRRAGAALRDLLPAEGVTVHEDVPTILPYFARADLLLYAPDDASGMKVKVLEAFATGVPVVTTPPGVEGIPAEDGVHAGIAEDDGGLVARAVELLSDPHRWEVTRANARELVARHCDPERILDALERAYERIG